MIYYFLGVFTSTTILLIIFILKYCKVEKKEKVIESDLNKLSNESPDVAIEHAEFYR